MAEGFSFNTQFSFDTNFVVPSDDENDDDAAVPTQFGFSFGLDQVLALDGTKVSEPLKPTKFAPFPQGRVLEQLDQLLPDDDANDDESDDKEKVRKGRFEQSFAVDVPFSFAHFGASNTSMQRKEADDEPERAAFVFAPAKEERAADEEWQLPGQQPEDETLPKTESPLKAMMRQTRDAFMADKVNRAIASMHEGKMAHGVVCDEEDDLMSHRHVGLVRDTKSQDPEAKTEFIGYLDSVRRKVIAVYKPAHMEYSARFSTRELTRSRKGVTLNELVQLSRKALRGQQRLAKCVWRHFAAACAANPLERIGPEAFLVSCYVAGTRALEVATVLLPRLDLEQGKEENEDRIVFAPLCSCWNSILFRVLQMFESDDVTTDEEDDEVVTLWALEKLLSFSAVVQKTQNQAIELRSMRALPFDVERCMLMALQHLKAPEGVEQEEEEDDEEKPDLGPLFWRSTRVMAWLRVKGFRRPRGFYEPALVFVERNVMSDKAVIKAVELLRSKPDDSLLRRMPADVFSYVLLPMLRWPPYEALRFPGLSSLEISTFVHARRAGHL